jgi:hypothetical protein
MYNIKKYHNDIYVAGILQTYNSIISDKFMCLYVRNFFPLSGDIEDVNCALFHWYIIAYEGGFQ